MTVPQGSRYQQGTITRQPNAGGVYNLTVLRTVQPSVTSYSFYTWQPGDRPDIVAYKTLGNSNLWWAIFDYNPEIIYPLSVPPGSVLRIPTAPVMGQGTLLQ